MLSHLNKCWLVANIDRVFGLPVVFGGIGVYGLFKIKDNIVDTIGILGIIATIAIAVFAFIVACKVCGFAYANFQEAISKRTKWKTSNVQQHEMKFVFALKAFVFTFFAIVGIVPLAVCLIIYFNQSVY